MKNVTFSFHMEELLCVNHPPPHTPTLFSLYVKFATSTHILRHIRGYGGSREKGFIFGIRDIV